MARQQNDNGYMLYMGSLSSELSQAYADANITRTSVVLMRGSVLVISVNNLV